MTTRILLAVVLSLLCAAPAWVPSDAFARGSGSSYSGDEDSSGEDHSSAHRPSKRRSHVEKDSDVQRDSRGRFKRSSSAKNRFKKRNPCPSTGESSGSCPGYIIDHMVPLKRGGADSPENMQWQMKDAAKAKDKVE